MTGHSIIWRPFGLVDLTPPLAGGAGWSEREDRHAN